jgi:hypothetical protein
MSLSSPGVHLFYHSRWQDTRVLDELCWGWKSKASLAGQSVATSMTARWLSKLAAKSSTLRVGLGLNATGDIALTHAQLPEDRALVRAYRRRAPDPHARRQCGPTGQSASLQRDKINVSHLYPNRR